MTMGQPFPGVWLPRDMNIHAGVSLANGSYEATYARAFANYKLADVKTRITIPKDERSPDRQTTVHGRRDVETRTDVPTSTAHASSTTVKHDAPQQDRIVDEIRVHGNCVADRCRCHQLAGMTWARPWTAEALADDRAAPEAERAIRDRRGAGSAIAR